MTLQERIIVSAYTGYLMCDFSKVHEYIEKTLGRPVWTHELADVRVKEEIRDKTRDAFLALCGNEDDIQKPQFRTADEPKCEYHSVQHGIGICMATKEMEATICEGDQDRCERLFGRSSKKQE